MQHKQHQSVYTHPWHFTPELNHAGNYIFNTRILRGFRQLNQITSIANCTTTRLREEWEIIPSSPFRAEKTPINPLVGNASNPRGDGWFKAACVGLQHLLCVFQPGPVWVVPTELYGCTRHSWETGQTLQSLTTSSQCLSFTPSITMWTQHVMMFQMCLSCMSRTFIKL